MTRVILAVALLASAAALADDISPQKMAEIQRDRDKEMAKIEKKYGSKKLSKSESQAKAAEQNAAEQKVLSQHGVSAKDYGRSEGTQTRAERAETQKALADLKKQDEAKAKSDASKKDGPKEIQVQKGFSEENPTVMDEKDGAPPIVEKGLPADGK